MLSKLTQPMRSHQNTAGTRFIECYDMVDNFKKHNHPTMKYAKQPCFTDTIQFNTEGHLLCIFQFDRQQSKTHTSYLLLLQHELHS